MNDEDIEIELKFWIKNEDISRITENLLSKGFSYEGRKYEKTTMYDNKNKIMQKSDGRIRLRQRGSSAEFSYKKPITREGIKKEIEYEVKISNLKVTEKILSAMEFSPVSSYERYRTEFRKGILKVTIDEFPFATFIEFEGPEKEISKLSGEEGFSMKENLTEPCDTLFAQWREKRGLEFKPFMKFEDYDK